MVKVTWLMVTIIGLACCGVSRYAAAADDPKGTYLSAFGARGDGVADDADALQAAINHVQETTRKGIVFVPEGQYRLGKTVYVWTGIRLIGWGAKRPTLVLGAKTPGFQEGEGKYLLHFVSERPREGQQPRDANPGTFYSGLSNINIEIKEGNPAAVGVRSHWAQHCFIAHCDFRLGTARAGVEQVGNEMEDCHFFGGDFGITTTKPSPSWPFILIDSSFEGQRKAGIETEEGGMTIIRNTFSSMPTAVLVREDRAEELIMKDCRLADLSGPALVISDDGNGRSQTNLTNVVCNNVPVLAQFRGSVPIAPLKPDFKMYRINSFTRGNVVADFGATPTLKTILNMEPLEKLPDPVVSDIPALPPPTRGPAC